MKKQKKQSLLNATIVILVIALVMMVGSIIYEEKINMSKQPIQNTNAPTVNEQENSETENEYENTDDDKTIIEEIDTNTDTEINEEELPVEENKNEVYVGEEENITSKEPEMATDEKVVDLVKNEWGKDESVTFSIEKKNGKKYRVAVRNSSTTVLAWYEVNIETWEVSEY